jgi:hypothetical protein
MLPQFRKPRFLREVGPGGYTGNKTSTGNPVVDFFVAVGAWLAASKTAQVIWTAFMIVTAAVGIKNFRTAQDLLSKGQDILATKVAAGGKVPIIYGTRRVGSQLIFLDTADNRSKDLFCVYALSVGEVDHIDLATVEINGVSVSDPKVFRDGFYVGSDKISSGAGSLNTATQIGGINQTSSGGVGGTDPTKRYRFVINAHHGAASQTVDPMLNASIPSKWTVAHKLNGIAYLAFSAEFDSKAMFKGLPQLTVVVRGKKVYDPRESGQTFGTPSTYAYSDNPALCFLDYISNAEYGKGLTASELNLSTFGTAATVCDTLVDTPDFNGTAQSVTFSGDNGSNLVTAQENIWDFIYSGDYATLTNSVGAEVFGNVPVNATSRVQPYDSTQSNNIYFSQNLSAAYASDVGTILIKNKRFQCHGVIDPNITVMENSQSLLAAMRGIFNYVDGKYELQVEDAGSSTFSVNDNHIISQGGINVSYGSKDNRYNKVVVNFFNAKKAYEADTVTVLHTPSVSGQSYTYDDGGEELEIKIDCEYVSSPYVAFNMGKALLVRSRYQTQISFQATTELYKCNVGDIIDITYAPLDLSSTLYRIETIDLMPDGLLNITAIIYFNVYTYELPAAANVAAKTNLPSAFALVAPSNLSFVDTDDSATGRPYLTWTAVDTYPVNEYRVIVKSGSVATYNNIVTSNYAFLDFLPIGSYTAEVTAINSVKAESEAGTLSFTIGDEPVNTSDIRDEAINLTKLANDVVDAIAAGGASSTELIKATSAPSTRADGSALQPQDLWADTNDNNQIYVRNAANNGWDKARDSSLVTLYNSLSTTVGTNTSNISTAESNIVTLTTDTAANATALTNLTATVGSNTSAISTEQTTRANADTALAGDISSLTSTVSGVSSSVTTNATAVSNINGNASAGFVLKTNAAGKIAQMVLGSNASSGSGATSIVSFLADTFQIDNGSGSSVSPFLVSGGAVFIDNARINNLSGTKIDVDTLNVKFFANTTPKIYSQTGVAVPLTKKGFYYSATGATGTAYPYVKGNTTITEARNDAQYICILYGVLGDVGQARVQYSYNNSNWYDVPNGAIFSWNANTYRPYTYTYYGTVSGLTSSQSSVYFRVYFYGKYNHTSLGLTVMLDNMG